MLRWLLREPRPVTLWEHLEWAIARVVILWCALAVAALVVEYGGLPIARFENVKEVITDVGIF